MPENPANSSVTYLECSLCTRKYEAGKAWNLCECGGPLLVRYDLPRLRESWSRDSFASAPNSMWRYAPPSRYHPEASIISLGEGMTPLLPAPAHRCAHRRIQSADQRRRPEPDRLLQSPRPLLRRLHVRRTRHPEALRFPPPATPPALSPPTPPPPESRPTSSCRRTFRSRTSSNAKPTARTSRWSTA